MVKKIIYLCRWPRADIFFIFPLRAARVDSKSVSEYADFVRHA